MNVIEIYNAVAYRVNKSSNGELTYAAFNELSWLGQLRLIDWLTGSMSGQEPPEPYLTQKNKDWLSAFITPYSQSVTDGSIVRPENYYQYENLQSLFLKETECEEDEEDDKNDLPKKPVENCGTAIQLLSGDKFNARCRSHIVSLRPSFSKPIAKQVGKKFVFAPSDIGNIVLEYIRYPERAVIKTKIDPVYNDEVPDTATTVNFEWDEKARDVLIYFISQQFLVHTRETGGTQMNELVGKTARK